MAILSRNRPIHLLDFYLPKYMEVVEIKGCGGLCFLFLSKGGQEASGHHCSKGHGRNVSSFEKKTEVGTAKVQLFTKADDQADQFVDTLNCSTNQIIDE